MKNTIKLAMGLLFSIAIITSCSKDEIDDFTKLENISGTTWECTSGIDWDEDLEYALLIFTSTTTVEGWTKYIDEGEQKDWTGSFTISNDRISISYDDDSFTGIIEGESMNLTIEDDKTYVFSKKQFKATSDTLNSLNITKPIDFIDLETFYDFWVAIKIDSIIQERLT